MLHCYNKEGQDFFKYEDVRIKKDDTDGARNTNTDVVCTYKRG